MRRRKRQKARERRAEDRRWQKPWKDPGMSSLRVASFTVHATVEQSARWKRAAEAEGHRSAGTWLAAAADAYLKARARAGAPVPLAWHRGSFE